MHAQQTHSRGENLNTVGSEDRIRGHYRNLEVQRLSNQQPIERIPMMEWQFSDTECLSMLDRQRCKTTRPYTIRDVTSREIREG